MPITAVTSRDYMPRSQIEVARIFNRKVPLTSRAFDTLGVESRARAFRIAGINKASLIQRAQNEISKAIRDRTSMRDLRIRLLALFVHAGVEPPSMAHLRTVMRTNMSAVDTIARNRILTNPAVVRSFPFWKYVTVKDSAVRAEHAALHGKIFKWDDPFWDKYDPPWDWGCRCSKIPVSRGELARLGIEVSTVADVRKAGIEPNKDFAFPRDQLSRIDTIALREFSGNLKQSLERRFSETDAEEARRLLEMN